MLTTMIGTAIGYFIASMVMCIIAFGVITSKKFMTWYMKKMMSLTKEITEELSEEFNDCF